MSEQENLNHELKAIEASLENVSLPDGNLKRGSRGRDELMYNAGWAAAMSSLNRQSAGEVDSTRESESDVVAVPAVPGQSRSRLFWPAATVLSSLACALMGVLLFVQNHETANPNGRVAVANSAAETDTPEFKTESPTVEEADLLGAWNDDAGNHNEGGFVDRGFVDRVLNLPPGQVLKSGLAFQSFASDTRLGSVSFRPSGKPSLREPPLTRRQLMEELLPTSRQSLPTWRTFFN